MVDGGWRRLEGLVLRLADWKGEAQHRWPGRLVIGVVEANAVGGIAFHVHPDGRALEISLVDVAEELQARGLASVLMDAVYAAYPHAWINHGLRTPEGARWWDRYRDPAPERNIHNRPPGEWSAYFDAVDVARDRTHNAYLNREHGLHGHSDAEYRYGQRLEQEFGAHAPDYVTGPDIARVDPTLQDLYAGALVYLPAELHRFVHDGTRPPAERARALLDHVGHGNLPRATDSWTGSWNTSAKAAFDDVRTAQWFQDVPSPTPATHLVHHVLPLQAGAEGPPPYTARDTYLQYTDHADISVALAGMSWRSGIDLRTVHSLVFDPAVRAAVPPDSPKYASAGYRARYDERGMLRPEGGSGATLEDRAGEIRAWAEQVIHDGVARSRGAPLPGHRGHGQPPSPAPPAPSGPRPGGR